MVHGRSDVEKQTLFLWPYLNAFLMVLPNMAIKFQNVEIFEKKVQFCTRHLLKKMKYLLSIPNVIPL